MAAKNPRGVRRYILWTLYELYQEDPLQMMAPEDFLEPGSLQRKDLASGAYYLHECGYIELMIGYSPPMFDAARISTKGIDLVEDTPGFNRLFPPEGGGDASNPAEAMALVMQVAKEADACSLQGVRRAWLLKDLENLRDELRKPSSTWRGDVVECVPRWMADYFEGEEEGGVEKQLPSLGLLTDSLAGILGT